jgi:hypothetical protein
MTAKRRLQTFTAAAALFAFAACSSVAAQTDGGLKLSGDQEVPPVTTTATGTSTIKIAADGTVSGSVTTTGMDGTMAHIHIAPMGKNGPVIVPFVKTADGVWSPQPGAKLTPDQLKAFQAGELYINVHTAANKGGEIRAQLKP